MTDTAINPALSGAKMGLLAGALCVTYLILLYWGGSHLLFSPWMFFCFAVIILFKIANAYMLWQKSNNQISFKDALGSLFMVSVVSLLALVTFYYVMFNQIDPSLMEPVREKLTENAIKSFDEDHITKVQLDAGLLRIQNISFSLSAASIIYSLLLFIGFFYSLVFAGIMRLIARDIAVRVNQQ